MIQKIIGCLKNMKVQVRIIGEVEPRLTCARIKRTRLITACSVKTIKRVHVLNRSVHNNAIQPSYGPSLTY